MPVWINGVWIALLPLSLMIMVRGGVFAAGSHDKILIAVLSYSCFSELVTSALKIRRVAVLYSSRSIPTACGFDKLLVDNTGQRWGE